MKTLLYSLNFSPEMTGIGKYNGELVNYLSQGYSAVSVITAPPYYPEWNRRSGFSNWWTVETSGNFFVYRCPLYVPTEVTTIKRLLHLLSFSVSSALRLSTLLKLKPDVLILLQPSLFCAPMALLYARLTGAKAVLHIQDYEVDAMFGLLRAGSNAAGQDNPGLFRKLVGSVESWLLRRFDMVSSISNSMVERAAQKGVVPERLRLFPNWSDTEFVAPDVDGADIRRAWGYTDKDKVVLYSGNIGEKQGLEIVLEAAQAFADRPRVKFLLIGAGAFSEQLQRMAVGQGLNNVAFKPLQPWEDVPKVLAMADVHLVVQKVGAADAVLPSKLTNILSAGGHALVTAEKSTELGKIADRHPGIYELVDPENTKAFIGGLERCLARDTTRPNMVARNYACEFLNKDKIINRFVADLQELVESKQSKVCSNEC
uniref:WcaI family glycosyltransferase n=1 Tax=Microbulbifer agarilyticus TaxID=260552 RepID=UPI0002DCC54F|nr:WcaI family glycosyltransferase [Microbulbifer agarilyticus]